MRESKFIGQKADQWKEYEEGLEGGNLGPDKLERAFIELNDDLAYARTFYRNRSVRVFLNNLLTPFYDRIYGSKRGGGAKKILSFFTETAPRIHYSAQRFMLVSLLTVMLGFMMGYFGTRHDQKFATTVLGPDYVRMTEENIAKGDPMGVYKDDEPAGMFFRIATNNLQVAFYFFLFGALFCVGTLYMLTVNGIVLGTFTYLFTSRGLTTEYLLTVYQHGTLEILTMVVEGAAGLMMGAGFLFPGTLSRVQSVQNAARKSITMFLVCVPIIMVAAFIESYLTRFTELDSILRLLIIGLSLLFMLFYFVVLPWLKFRGNRSLDLQEEQPRVSEEKVFRTGEMHTVGEILLFSINRLRTNFTRWAVLSLLLGSGLYYMVSVLGRQAMQRDVEFEFRSWLVTVSSGDVSNILEAISASMKLLLWNLYSSRYLFNISLFPELLLSLWILWTAVIFMTMGQNRTLFGSLQHPHRIWYQAPLLAIFPTALLWFAGGAWWLALWLGWPLIMQSLGVAMAYRQGMMLQGFGAGLRLMTGQLLRFVGGIMVVLLIYLMFSLGIWLLVTVMLSFTSGMHSTAVLSPGVMKFYVWLNYAIWPALLLAGGHFFMLNGMTMFEKQTGTSLFRKIDEIGFRKEVYGVETE